METITTGVQVLTFRIGINNENKKFKVNVSKVWLNKDDDLMISVVLDKNGKTCDFCYNEVHKSFAYESGSNRLADKILSLKKEDKMFDYGEVEYDDETFNKKEQQWNDYLNEITELVF